MAAEYWSHYYMSQIASLYKLRRLTKKRLNNVFCPVFVMLSEKDSSVSLKAGEVIAMGIEGPVEKLILKNSPHVFLEGPEKDLVINKVIEWLKFDNKGDR
jgi:esterase/lipase